MSAQIAEFYARLSVDSSALQKGLEDANKKLDGLAKQGGKTGGAMDMLKGNLMSMVNPATLAATAVTGLGLYLRQSTKAAAESAQVDAKLAAVLKATGNAAGLTAGEINGMADSLSAMSGMDDEVIKNGAAIMATFREIGEQVFPQAMQAALDMSAVMGQDLQSSIMMIGKALNDPIAGMSALRKNGVQLTDQQQDQVKSFMAVGDIASAQGVILGELGMEFGGAAQAMQEAGDGSDILKVSTGNLSEAIGKRLLPVQRAWNLALADGADALAASIEAGTAYSAVLDEVAEKHNMSSQTIERYGKYSQAFTEQIEREVNEYRRAEQYGLAWDAALQSQNAALMDSGASLKDFNSEMDALSQILDGALGSAQEKHNERIAEYTQQLAEARSEKEKDEINANIAAETAEYNKRAQAIAFNIQQERIMNSGLGEDTKLNMITALGLAYGQYDQATANAINSTGNWIARVEEGTLSEEKAIQYLTDYTGRLMDVNGATEDSAKVITDIVEPMQHVAARAAQAAGDFDAMGNSAVGMGDKINSTATPAVGGLKSQINGLQDKEVNVDVNIRVHGSMPSGLFGNANTTTTSKGIEDLRENTGGGRWTGGPLDNGVFVGDGPGGVMTPYTEYIANGWVYSAAETRKMVMMGLIGKGAKHRMFGGEIESPWVISGGGSGGSGGKPKGGGKGRVGSSLPVVSGGLGGDSEAEAIAAETAASTAAFITPQVQQAIQQATGMSVQQVSNTNQIVDQQRQMIYLLSTIANNSSPVRNAKANLDEEHRAF